MSVVCFVEQLRNHSNVSSANGPCNSNSRQPEAYSSQQLRLEAACRMLSSRAQTGVSARTHRCRKLLKASYVRSSRRSRQQQSSVQVAPSIYSQPAQQAIRHAQQEACRQGSMFLAPPHLIQVVLGEFGIQKWSHQDNSCSKASGWFDQQHHRNHVAALQRCHAEVRVRMPDEAS